MVMDIKNIKKEITYLNIGDEDKKNSKMQNVKSFAIRRTIKLISSVAVNKVHSDLKGKYDKDMYIYSDPRLLFLDKFAKEFIKDNVKSKSNIDLLNKIVDIALGLCKEDIYYRVRVLEFLNRFMEENVRFVLTEEEEQKQKQKIL
jgi:hypothetical protein